MTTRRDEIDDSRIRRLLGEIGLFLVALLFSFVCVSLATLAALNIQPDQDLPATIRAQSTANYRENLGAGFESIDIAILLEATADSFNLSKTPENREGGINNPGIPVIPSIPTSTPTPEVTETNTPLSSTSTNTPLSTPDPQSTSTESPTPNTTSTPTPIPPTFTPILPTFTPLLPTPITPTFTPITPTTPPPSATPTLSPTPTTINPATATPSLTPLPSNSPTATSSATLTSVPTITNTPAPTFTPTSTLIPSPTPDYQPIIPFFVCRKDNGNGTFTAFFGYRNFNSYSVNIPIGSNNRFSPPPIDRGQPSNFSPGVVNPAVEVDYDGTALIWHLDGTNESAGTDPCQ